MGLSNKLVYPFKILIKHPKLAGSLAVSTIVKHKGKSAAFTAGIGGAGYGINQGVKSLRDYLETSAAELDFADSIYVHRLEPPDYSLSVGDATNTLEKRLGPETLVALEHLIINLIFGDTGIFAECNSKGLSPDAIMTSKQAALDTWRMKCMASEKDYNFIGWLKDANTASIQKAENEEKKSASDKKEKKKKGPPTIIPGNKYQNTSYNDFYSPELIDFAGEETDIEDEEEEEVSNVSDGIPTYSVFKREVFNLAAAQKKNIPPEILIEKTYNTASATTGEYQLDMNSVSQMYYKSLGWSSAFNHKIHNLVSSLESSDTAPKIDTDAIKTDVTSSEDYVFFDTGSSSSFEIWPYALIDAGLNAGQGPTSDGGDSGVNEDVFDGLIAFYNDNKLWQRNISLSGLTAFKINGQTFPKGIILRKGWIYNYDRHKERNKFYSRNNFHKAIHAGWEAYLNSSRKNKVKVNDGSDKGLAFWLDLKGIGAQDKKTIWG